MKRNARILVIRMLLTIVGVNLIMVSLSYAQPKIPKENFPANIPSGVREQIENLYSSDIKVRVSAVRQLGEFGDKASYAVPFLISILDDKSGYLDGVPMRVGSLVIQPSNIRVCDEAIKALVTIRNPSVEPLITALRNKNEKTQIRIFAAVTLWQIADIRAVEPLIATLKDKDNDKSLRFQATTALGALGKKDLRAIEALIGALEDEDEDVHNYARIFLEEITGQKLGGKPSKWQEWWETNKAKQGK